MESQRVEQLRQFIQYAAALPDVYFVTNQQVRGAPCLVVRGTCATRVKLQLCRQRRRCRRSKLHAHPPPAHPPSHVPAPQLLAWMQKPVSSSAFAAQLTCVRPTDIAAGTPVCSTYVGSVPLLLAGVLRLPGRAGGTGVGTGYPAGPCLQRLPAASRPLPPLPVLPLPPPAATACTGRGTAASAAACASGRARAAVTAAMRKRAPAPSCAERRSRSDALPTNKVLRLPHICNTEHRAAAAQSHVELARMPQRRLQQRSAGCTPAIGGAPLTRAAAPPA